MRSFIFLAIFALVAGPIQAATIANGASVEANSGAATDKTQRVSVATDDVVSIDDNAGSLTVDGTVAATKSGTWTLDANSGVDVGDVTVNNAAGASAVNIQDGGNSLTVDGTVNVGTSGLPTGAATSAIQTTSENLLKRLTGTAGVIAGTRMLDNGVLVTPKFAVIAATVNGDNTIVAAVAGKRIRVLSYLIVADGNVSARFESGAGGTALSGAMPFANNSGAAAAYSPVGVFQTGINTLLNLELTGTPDVFGHLTYIEVN